MMSNGRYIGTRTNNQAEYEALIAAMEFAASLNPEEIVCHLDSELVAKQLIGEYTVKNTELKKLWRKVIELSRQFKNVSFIRVPRTNRQIQKADALVNEALDRELRQHYAENHFKS